MSPATLPGHRTAFLLPGQGAQYPGMAVELYGRQEVFTASMDEFFELMGAEGRELRADWLSEHPAVPLDDASRAQPLLFAIGCSVGRAVSALGARPDDLVGHSVGELAAAALAGVFGPASAARIMSARSAALADAPPGGLLAVAASPEQLATFTGLPHDPSAVVVGAINTPVQTVLAGPEYQLTQVRDSLRAAGMTALAVPARQPFHSPAVRAAAVRFEVAFGREPLSRPRIQVWSTRTGLPVTEDQAVDPEFWAGQLAEPVLFWSALSGLLESGAHTLVETGPGQTLSLAARRHRSVRSAESVVMTMLPSSVGGSWAHWQQAVERLTERLAAEGGGTSAEVSK